MSKTDLHKEFRDSLDGNLEQKFMHNLQWSMTFFAFNYIANLINNEMDFDKNHVQKQFIKHWQKFAHENIVKSDLKTINEILSSPKNLFYSALQNEDEVTESTEIYQEKYNAILKKIEEFFLNTIKSQPSEEDMEDDE